MPHIHELYDFVVTVYVVYGDSVLFVHHPRYDKWLPIGGHIELNEDPEEALWREIREECGLDVEILSERSGVDAPGYKQVMRPNVIDVHEANPPHKHIALVYFARAKSGGFCKSDEHTEMRWIPEGELVNAEYTLSAVSIEYARQALALARV